MGDRGGSGSWNFSYREEWIKVARRILAQWYTRSEKVTRQWVCHKLLYPELFVCVCVGMCIFRNDRGTSSFTTFKKHNDSTHSSFKHWGGGGVHRQNS